MRNRGRYHMINLLPIKHVEIGGVGLCSNDLTSLHRITMRLRAETKIGSGLNLLIGRDKRSAIRQGHVCLRINVGWRSLFNLQTTGLTHYRMFFTSKHLN